jgi:Tfp pilus assembly protein PilO
MYAKRNSLTIGILWVVLLAIGIFWYSQESKRIKILKVKNKQLSQQLDGSLEIAKALQGVEQQYRFLREKWNLSPKQIIASEEPSFSLDYLNWLVSQNDFALEFDFELKNITDNGDIVTFRFLLTGEGSYHDLFRLIWHLTKNPLLYQIETFTISQSQNEKNLIEFMMELKGFSLTQKLDAQREFNFDSMEPLVENVMFYDSFKPLNRAEPVRRATNIFRNETPQNAPKPVDKALVDVESATLQAVANGRVYIKDQNNKLLTMRVGDKVQSGALTRINQKKSEVEFVLEKAGGARTVTLGLGYKK